MHSVPLPPPPSLEQRLAARTEPPGFVVMRQQWRDLLFLHWRVPAEQVQATLPPGLWTDTHDGHAWLGIVPFMMRNVRPRFLPPVPGLSDFPELNLRTYVHDDAGIPGVWFYSLDADQWLAVEIARRLFGLPYEHARMSAEHAATGAITFRSERRRGPMAGARTAFTYAAGRALPPAAPGSLEFFLVERYRLYAGRAGHLRRGTVAHAPYPLHEALVSAHDEQLLPLNGFAPTGRPPDHAVYSPGVDVRIFGLERVGGA